MNEKDLTLRLFAGSQPLTARQSRLQTIYREFNAFASDFTPEKVVVSDFACCGAADIPTITDLSQVYGEVNACRWVYLLCADLARFCSGNALRFDESAAISLSRMIVWEYGFLNIREVLLFFHRFKCAMYGQFFRSFEPLVVMKSLRTFLRERANALARKQMEEDAAERARMGKDAVTYNEYLKLQGIDCKNDYK